MGRPMWWLPDDVLNDIGRKLGSVVLRLISLMPLIVVTDLLIKTDLIIRERSPKTRNARYLNNYAIELKLPTDIN